MVRTQIQLQEQQVRLLKQLAALQQTSMAEMIRRAIDQFTASAGSGNVTARRKRALDVAGRFHSGHPDLGARHDAHLAAALK